MFKSRFRHGEYLASKGLPPKNLEKNYLVSFLDLDLPSKATEDDFQNIVALCAARSSVGLWDDNYSKNLLGTSRAKKLKALAFDLNFEEKTFKIAYPKEIFEPGNMSNILSTVIGSLWNLDEINGLRCLDIYFPEDLIKSFPGPQFGVYGSREKLVQDEGPLFLTVPLPSIGMTAREEANLAKNIFTSCKGEYHGIQDPENLTDTVFNRFEDRCKYILQLKEEIEAKISKNRIYIPNITHSSLDKMIERSDVIKSYGGEWLMLDTVTTGFSALHSLRQMNPGLIIHASRGMNSSFANEFGQGAYENGEVRSFSISAVLNAKIHRLLGADSFDGGNVSMQNESKLIRDVLQLDITPKSAVTLGQNWFGMRSVWYLVSRVAHPGEIPIALSHLGGDILLQSSEGVLGHPWGIEAGAQAMLEAKEVALGRGSLEDWIASNPTSALAKSASHWGFTPKTV
jgi:ribulose-bisphosphate carboxylase large chain